MKEADEKEPIKAGFVYLAPANYHLLVEPDKTVGLSVDPRVCYSRPSIDALFETAAEVYQAGLIGVVLTGASHDGTAGLRKVKEKGGLSLAQDPATGEAEVMPLSAIRGKVVDKVLPLAEIAAFLKQMASKGRLEKKPGF